MVAIHPTTTVFRDAAAKEPLFLGRRKREPVAGLNCPPWTTAGI